MHVLEGFILPQTKDFKATKDKVVFIKYKKRKQPLKINHNLFSKVTIE